MSDTIDPALPASDLAGDPSRRRWWIACVILAVTLVAPVLLMLAWPRSAFEAIDITGAPWGRDLHLRDQYGRMRSLADFRGDVVLLFFGFTQCPEVCPTTLARAADVVKRLGPDGRRVQVLFVTLDPERDTPAILTSYMGAFDPRFIALWADQAGVDQAARDFHIFYQRVPTGSSYTLDHTAITYAFDPQGRLRLAIGHEQTAAMVAHDVKELLGT
jgi:protein SCO1/2